MNNQKKQPFIKINFRKIVFVCIFLLYSCSLIAQNKGFKLTYNAKRLGDSCFQLTDATNFKNGAVWSQNRIDLNQNFRIYANLNFGTNISDGADGIGFVIQYLGSNLGTAGEGIGFGGISPSLGIEYDTYENPYDPSYDHIALIKNGNSQHVTSPSNTLKGPNIPLKTNGVTVKDGKYYPVSILWNATSKTLICNFNGVQKINHVIDLQKDIFKDSQYVYWGFTAATGGYTNYHYVCIDSFFVTYENECRIGYKNQSKPYILCNPTKDTLTFKFNEIPNVYSKITWSTGDTTKKIVQPINQTNKEFWAKIKNKYGTCTDTIKFNIIEPKLKIDSQFNFECTTKNKKFVVPGTWTTVLWNDNSTNSTKILSNPGKYWVEGTDKYNCKARDTFDYIIRPDTLKILTSQYEHPTCFGNNNGYAEVLKTNRVSGTILTYNWLPNGASTSKNSLLKSGNYQCIVTDVKGCSDSIKISLFDPPKVKISLKNKKDVLCNGDKNGQFEVTGSNGKNPYIYSMNGKTQLTGQFNPVTPGIHTVYLKDSAGCTDSLTVNIGEPDSLNLAISGFQGDCFGDSKGRIEATVSGGTKPYVWSPSATKITVIPNGEKMELLNLSSKNYLITLTDAHGCKKSVTQFISPKENIQISIDTSIKFNIAELTQISAKISPPGKYTYNWSPEKIFGSQKNDSAPKIKLYDKSYIQLTVTNENFCTKSINFEIPVLIPPIYFWFPTAFTPDESGLNDGYAPVGNFDWADFQIYNRWGEKIFHSTRQIQHWDGTYMGKPCQEGVYIIVARLKYERFEQKRDGRSSFTLLR